MVIDAVACPSRTRDRHPVADLESGQLTPPELGQRQHGHHVAVLALARRQLTSEAYALRLLDALRSDTAPAIRHHDGTNLL